MKGKDKFTFKLRSGRPLEIVKAFDGIAYFTIHRQFSKVGTVPCGANTISGNLLSPVFARTEV